MPEWAGNIVSLLECAKDTPSLPLGLGVDYSLSCSCVPEKQGFFKTKAQKTSAICSTSAQCSLFVPLKQAHKQNKNVQSVEEFLGQERKLEFRFESIIWPCITLDLVQSV